ncbi:hypothetical protein TcYC6_0055180 [Trypanosoma cruzi]|nr:hypothetical protein TcYC6_0055180 [Trypanosoma cruzi]
MTRRRNCLLHVLKATLYDWPKDESLVHEVLLVWNGVKETVPDELLALKSRCRQPPNSVANRWLVASLLRTEAVLNIDDDMNVSYDAARCMFSIWLRSRSSLVATDVRAIVDCGKTMEQRKYNLSFVYVARERLRGIGLSHRVALPRALLSSRVYYVVFGESFTGLLVCPRTPA